MFHIGITGIINLATIYPHESVSYPFYSYRKNVIIAYLFIILKLSFTVQEKKLHAGHINFLNVLSANLVLSRVVIDQETAYQ